VDPLEEELPDVGLVTMRSTESGELVEVDASARLVREAWNEAAQRRRAKIHDVLMRAGVDRFDLRIGEDLADPLVAFFRRRETRRRLA
jgi:uncharacterized protein (DUF58 family)